MIDDYGIEWEYDPAAGYWVQTGNKYPSKVPIDPVTSQTIPVSDDDPSADCVSCSDNRGGYCAVNLLSLGKAAEVCPRSA